MKDKITVLKKIEQSFSPDSYEQLLEMMFVLHEPGRQYPSYDKDVRLAHATAQIKSIFAITGRNTYSSMIDVGCGMGHVPCAANALGIPNCVGIDIMANDTWAYYQQRAKDENSLEYNVLDLCKELYERKFQLITSYAAFEHFSNPRDMLEIMLNMLEPGGHLFIHFEPIWNSKDGHHLYRINQTPWFHLLFSQDILHTFYKDHQIKYEAISKDSQHEIIGGNYFNKYSALDWYTLFCTPRKNSRLIHITPIIRNDYDWFLEIFGKHLPLPILELKHQGFISVFEKL